MKLVEQEITQNNIERARLNLELEKLQEIEKKLTTTNPELLQALFKPMALPVEQMYLSTPHDEFSLRIRSIVTPEGTQYTTTQKNRGEVVDEALQRSEVETTISANAYTYYQSLELPTVRKFRANVMEGVTVDFYDDKATPVIIEIEHKDSAVRGKLLATMQGLTGNSLIDRSDDPSLTNEAIAYREYAKTSNTEHLRSTPESLDTFSERVLAEMVALYATGKNRVVTGLTGMSGSGKTTVTNAIKSRLIELYGETFTPVIISTDDYHFGKKRLEADYGSPYNEWDTEKTYDTEQLAQNLKALVEGYPIPSRHFDFETEEPINDGVITNSPFVIIEGLYAGSKQLDRVRDLHFQLPTGIATAIGRDVRRLVIDDRANRAFPTPQSRLRYQIEVALPEYLKQEMPRHRPFSESTRLLASRAFMMTALSK